MQTRWLPGVQTLRRYERAWWRRDLVAGLVLTTMIVPVGVAYAEASGVPGINGLYATIAGLIAYAVFGPSRILVLGPDSSLAAIILAVVLPLSGGDAHRATDAAALMALVTGIVCVGAGLARLGFITELLSKPIRYGYMNGIAVTVMLSQAPKIVGRSTATLAIGVSVLALILILKRWPRIPGILIAVAGATVAVAALDLAQHAGVAVLGPLPAGLPMPAIPAAPPGALVPIITGGLAVALVAFADTSVLSRSYAARLNMRVDPNQEMIGLGMANLAAGVCQGFPIASSSSRTPVAEAAGARTQLAGVVAAILTAVLILAAPNLLQHLPQAALAAVVIASAISLIQIADLLRIYRIQQWEFWLSMACFAGVVVFGAIPGIAVAIVIAVIEFLWDGWRPHSAVLGRVNRMKGYHDISRHPEAREVPGLVLFRWDAPLFFANAEFFSTRAFAAVERAPVPARWLVIAAEPVTSVDVTAADSLAELDDRLQAAGVELHFAELKDPVKDKLARFGLVERFGKKPFFATLGEAVNAYLASHQVDWVDWEDR